MCFYPINSARFDSRIELGDWQLDASTYSVVSAKSTNAGGTYVQSYIIM